MLANWESTNWERTRVVSRYYNNNIILYYIKSESDGEMSDGDMSIIGRSYYDFI